MSQSVLSSLKHKLEIEYLPIELIKIDPSNARQHSKAQIKQIAESIRTFGYNAPGLIDDQNVMLVGNGRLLALRYLGHTEMPVIRLRHMTAEQARAFAIADNRLTENSTWDETLLAAQFKALSEIDLDFSLDVMGFSIGEIDLLIEGAEKASIDSADDLPALQSGPTICRPGDLWTLGGHRILCGDALDESHHARLMGSLLAAMAFTDAPYNRAPGDITGKGQTKHRPFAMAIGEMTEAEFVAFLSRVMKAMARFTAKGSIHFHFMDWQHSAQLQQAARGIYDALLNICVWTKPGGMGGLYRSAHEFVHVYRLGAERHTDNVKLGKFGRNRTNAWTTYGGPTSLRTSEDADLLAGHPTPKPVRLVADAILDVSARKDLVLDPFLGTGTTLIACERTGRRCRGIEIDPLYVDLTIRRWQRLTGEAARREDGRTFDELVAEVQS